MDELDELRKDAAGLGENLKKLGRWKEEAATEEEGVKVFKLHADDDDEDTEGWEIAKVISPLPKRTQELGFISHANVKKDPAGCKDILRDANTLEAALERYIERFDKSYADAHILPVDHSLILKRHEENIDDEYVVALMS
ncbi:hypothetical protein GNI_086060 [Gregarina niphandrodes]|uniref:Uncharacterized protein n=1 Tax=Gregarina niphandrodes TaxID=110365 RepID=A0A023B692_GRENI|nr:hypothetical protein GNI_086060 [Gregarina niphandrodes]EZG64222.1 hypothetical protein GNI_086060 [Gregarina niphandrodes]|eukprot:XP_011130647.1 hypothetical protein GNI_086060 [Gregarina niphandrodes]